MDRSTEIVLNQLAQGHRSQEEALTWFIEHSAGQQQHIVHHLASLASQAGAVGRHGPLAMERAGLKSSFPACVLLRRAAATNPLGSAGLRQTLAKILALPPRERARTFVLLLSLLGIADAERRAREPPTCTRHWWHRDLRDPKVVAQLLKEGEC